jgi:hypothetical protein
MIISEEILQLLEFVWWDHGQFQLVDEVLLLWFMI